MHRSVTAAALAALAFAFDTAAAAAQALPPTAQTGPLTLHEAVALAQRQGPRAVAARHTLDAARASFSAYSARQLPQIFLSGDVPSYNRAIIPAPQPDGSLQFRSQQQTNSSLNLFVSQVIPQTGGSFSVVSQLAQLKRSGAPETWSSTPFSFNLVQPILRSNTLRWTRAERILTSELAERAHHETIEDVSGAAAAAFILLGSVHEALLGAVESLERNARLRERTRTRFGLGAVSTNDVRRAELAYLRAQQTVNEATLARDEAEATLRATLGLPVSAPVELVVPGEPPLIEVDSATAVAVALRYRSESVLFDLEDTRGRRSESEARYDGGLGATLTASYGYNTTAAGFNDVYDGLLDRQTLRLSVDFPLWQWGASSADRAGARASRAATSITAQDTREQIERDVAFSIRRLAQARLGLAIAIQADSVATDRARDALVRYDFGSLVIDNLFLALDDEDQSEQQRIVALANCWAEFFRLRRLTMYDFEVGRPIR
jgi:outer membrane protein TolC